MLCVLLLCLKAEARDLPGDLQVDLIFPQPNKTYTPTEWFPIILGIQGLQSLWPLPFYITVDFSIPTEGQETGWDRESHGLMHDELVNAVNSTPGNIIFHIPSFNIKSVTDRFWLGWTITFGNRCFEPGEEVEAKKNITDGIPEDRYDYYGYWSFWERQHTITYEMRFHTGPNGTLPDIQAAAEQCQDLAGYTSQAMHVSRVVKDRGMCPIFEPNDSGTNCNYRSVAKDLAANVSSLIVDGRFHCKEGDWRTMKTECPEEDNKASSRTKGTGRGWLLGLTIPLVLTSLL
jgi:hypothetical protein